MDLAFDFHLLDPIHRSSKTPLIVAADIISRIPPQKETPAGYQPAGVRLSMRQELESAHVSGLRALRTFDDLELYRFAFPKGLKAFSLNRGVVDKDVLAAGLFDKPVAFTFVEPLDGTFRHDPLPFLPRGETAPHVRWPL